MKYLLNIQDDLHKQMKLDCVEHGISINSFIVSAISYQLGTMPAGDDFPPEEKIPTSAISLEQVKEEVSNLNQVICSKCGKDLTGYAGADRLTHMNNCEGKGKK